MTFFDAGTSQMYLKYVCNAIKTIAAWRPLRKMKKMQFIDKGRIGQGPL